MDCNDIQYILIEQIGAAGAIEGQIFENFFIWLLQLKHK